MTSRARLLPLAALAWAALASPARTQTVQPIDNQQDARAALARAVAQQKAAELRERRFEQDAARASLSADRSAASAAALAARIQQSEAGLAAAEARLRLIERQRAVVRARLAERQRPLVQLMGALQNLSRRPPVLALLRPGSLRDTVFLRALLASAMPEVERRTAGLRAEIARLRSLQAQTRQGAMALRRAEATLESQRRRLAALEARHRLESRAMRGIAAREADRALAMGEQARDLDALLGGLDRAARLKAALAALPGPVPRPLRPDQSPVAAPSPAAPAPIPDRSGAPGEYQFPVAGRLIAGFGAVTSPGVRSAGITLAPRAGAQIVSPGTGSVAFAGPFRGYGRIVIVEHPDGWTSLVTGLARVDVEVGDRLRGGSPLGIAGGGRPTVTLELRRDGEPVNPLEYL